MIQGKPWRNLCCFASFMERRKAGKNAPADDSMKHKIRTIICTMAITTTLSLSLFPTIVRADIESDNIEVDVEEEEPTEEKPSEKPEPKPEKPVKNEKKKPTAQNQTQSNTTNIPNETNKPNNPNNNSSTNPPQEEPQTESSQTAKDEKYSIIFRMPDGEKIKTEKVKKGKMPDAPDVQESYFDGETEYVFTGWNPQIKKATKNTYYTAMYEMKEPETPAETQIQSPAETQEKPEEPEEVKTAEPGGKDTDGGNLGFIPVIVALLTVILVVTFILKKRSTETAEAHPAGKKAVRERTAVKECTEKTQNTDSQPVQEPSPAVSITEPEPIIITHAEIHQTEEPEELLQANIKPESQKPTPVDSAEDMPPEKNELAFSLDATPDQIKTAKPLLEIMNVLDGVIDAEIGKPYVLEPAVLDTVSIIEHRLSKGDLKDAVMDYNAILAHPASVDDIVTSSIALCKIKAMLSGSDPYSSFIGYMQDGIDKMRKLLKITNISLMGAEEYEKKEFLQRKNIFEAVMAAYESFL